MTIGPDDLPDPFGEGGLAQVACGCLSETMHLVLAQEFGDVLPGVAVTVQVRCASCQRLQAEFPVAADISGHLAAQAGGFSAPGERTTIAPPPPRPGAGAAWGEPPGVPPPPPGSFAADDPTPPPLPKFSPEVCNVYLDGGPYDGHTMWLMAPGQDDFVVSGVARYAPTGQTREGRRVYRWDRKPR